MINISKISFATNDLPPFSLIYDDARIHTYTLNKGTEE